MARTTLQSPFRSTTTIDARRSRRSTTVHFEPPLSTRADLDGAPLSFVVFVTRSSSLSRRSLFAVPVSGSRLSLPPFISRKA
ncbi:hypothetical protein E2542_SST14024 [Spatholobus suberectus]|nr:hypothetical protein E2542_SST14024 [Spatholobus suberectus]